MSMDSGANLGTAYGRVVIDASGVRAGMDEARRAFSAGLSGIGDGLRGVGQQLSGLGSQLTQTFTPFAAGLGVATRSAVNFEESIANIAAVMGRPLSEMQAMSNELQRMGEESRFGPQSVADAMYDVVGGVADASTHMDILTNAIALAEAGNANLGGATNAMISIMNSYGYSADQAAFASDVLTRTVGMGVGTMDQFASALPQVTGLANSMGIRLEDLGASAAYLTTQGNTASQATTQLGAMMSALLNPNERMRAGLQRLGFASGRAAVEQLGLVGAYQALAGEFGQDAIAPMVGSVEALRGVTALASENFTEFSETYVDGIDGATTAAREIQMESAAAQFDLLKSSISGLAIEIGQAMLPVLNDIVGAVRPVIRAITGWVQENPGLARTIGVVVAALGVLGPILIGIGGFVTAVGTAIGGLGAAFGLLFSPIGLIVGAIAGLYAAFQSNLGGIRDLVQPVIDTLSRGFERLVFAIDTFFAYLRDFGLHEAILGIFGEGTMDETMQSTLEGVLVSFGMARDRAIAVVQSLYQATQRVVNTVRGVFETLATFITQIVIPGFQALVSWFVSEGLPAIVNFVIDVALPAIRSFFEWLGTAWETVIRPGLEAMYTWFVVDALPAIAAFITGTVIPAIQSFFQFLANAWAVVAPALVQIANWFLTEAVPAIVAVIRDQLLPLIQTVINTLAGLWAVVAPALAALATWFLQDALPAILNFISGTVIPAIGQFINVLRGIWEVVGPIITFLVDWFITTGLPLALDFINNVAIPIIQTFIGILQDIWNLVSPVIQGLIDWFTTTGWPIIEGVITGVITPAIQGLIDILAGIWSAVSVGINLFRDSLSAVFNFVSTNIIQPVIDLIESIVEVVQRVAGTVGDVVNGISSTVGGAINAVEAASPFRSGTGVLRGIDNTGGFLRDVGRGISGIFRDSGGPGWAGQAYMIGAGAQPELFVPSTNGQFIPNFDRVLSAIAAGSQQQSPLVGSMNVYANSYEEGQAAGRGAWDQIEQLRRAQG
jgi:TP901 family phage tail tape measure protein